MKHFFLKQLPQNPFLVNGERVKFDALVGDVGVITLDDENPQHKIHLAGLAEAAKTNLGGVSRIDEAAYNEQKKKPLLKTSAKPKEYLRVLSPFPNKPGKKSAAPVAAPAPASEPETVEQVQEQLQNAPASDGVEAQGQVPQQSPENIAQSLPPGTQQKSQQPATKRVDPNAK